MLSARVGQYFKWVGQSPEWVGHGLPGLGLEPPLVLIIKTAGVRHDRHHHLESRWAKARGLSKGTLPPGNI